MMVTETIGEGLHEGSVSDAVRAENSQSLVDVIRSIEAVPDYVVVDKHAAMRTVFDRWATDHPYLRNARARRTTLSDEYERIFGKYDGWKTFAPRPMPDQLRQEGNDFAEMCGEAPMVITRHTTDLANMAATYGMNSVGTGVGMAIVIPLIARLMYPWAWDNWKVVAGEAVLGAFMGAAAGASTAIIEEASLARMRTSAAYLDRKIEEAYR